MDRWAGSDGEYDRRADGDRPYELWAQNDHRPDTDRHYDLWAAADPEYDRWAAADSEYDHLAETGGEYDGRNRLAGIARSPKVKWIGLLVAWIIVTGVLLAVHLIILIWVIMVGLIGYVVYAVVRETPRGARPQRRHATTAAEIADDDRERFNTPPGWPEPPPDWTPPPGWQPNPAWPPAPPGWQFWLPPARRGDNERAARASHHRREPDDYRFTDDWR